MITVEATDIISALDLAERLQRYAARASALDGDAQAVVVEHVPTGQLGDVLGSISDWADAYGLTSVALRVGSANYRLRLDRHRGLVWHDVAELPGSS